MFCRVFEMHDHGVSHERVGKLVCEHLVPSVGDCVFCAGTWWRVVERHVRSPMFGPQTVDLIVVVSVAAHIKED